MTNANRHDLGDLIDTAHLDREHAERQADRCAAEGYVCEVRPPKYDGLYWHCVAQRPATTKEG